MRHVQADREIPPRDERHHWLVGLLTVDQEGLLDPSIDRGPGEIDTRGRWTNILHHLESGANGRPIVALEVHNRGASGKQKQHGRKCARARPQACHEDEKKCGARRPTPRRTSEEPRQRLKWRGASP